MCIWPTRPLIYADVEPMDVDGHAEVNAILAEQADTAANGSLEKALDPHTGMLSRPNTLSSVRVIMHL